MIPGLYRALSARQSLAASVRLAAGMAAWAMLAAAQPAASAPAPWHWWRSKVDGQRICSQISPGAGWTQDSGPYEGSGCQPKPRVFVVPMR